MLAHRARSGAHNVVDENAHMSASSVRRSRDEIDSPDVEKKKEKKK